MEVSGRRANSFLEVCDICENNKANGFCNDCDEYMCHECYKNHKTAKPCRNHVLTSHKTSKDTMKGEVLTTPKIIQENASDSADDYEPALTSRGKQPSTDDCKPPLTSREKHTSTDDCKPPLTSREKHASTDDYKPPHTSCEKHTSTDDCKPPLTSCEKHTSTDDYKPPHTSREKQSATDDYKPTLTSREKHASTDDYKPPHTSREKQSSTGKMLPSTDADPRSHGFYVGTRVRHVFFSWKGTVKRVNPEGNFTVKWDGGGTDLIRGSRFYTVKPL